MKPKEEYRCPEFHISDSHLSIKMDNVSSFLEQEMALSYQIIWKLNL